MPVSLPELHVTLGMYLDGPAWPDWPDNNPNARCLGPGSLLSLLESWFGLPVIPGSHNLRVAHCLRAARELGNGTFYAASLEKAPWASARRLLAMLDELTAAGWQGQTTTGKKSAPKRLGALAALRERMPEESRADTTTRRLQRLTGMLEAHPLPQALAGITLLEAKRAWPNVWQRLFDSLERRGVRFGEWQDSRKQPLATGYLGSLQQALAGMGKKPTRAKAQKNPQNDLSLVLLECGTLDEAAEATALVLRHLGGQGTEHGTKHGAQNGATVLLRASGEAALDQALARFNLPTCGHDTTSPANSILQLLPVCLRLHRAPFSAQTLLDFLLLDISPVKRSWRSSLIYALHRSPGIGNDLWDEAVVKIKEYMKKDGKTDEEIERQWQEAMAWMQPGTLFAETERMTRDILEDCCDRLANWARQRVHIGNDKPQVRAMLGTLARQCSELRDMAQHSGAQDFSWPELEDMLGHVAAGASVALAPGQAAPWAVVNHPGQLHGPCDTLVWWPFDASCLSGQASRFWTGEEQAWLAANKVSLPATHAHRDIDFASFCRAVSLVGKTCIFVLPGNANGAELQASPFLDIVDHALRDAGGLGAIRRTAAELRAGYGIQEEPIPPQALPTLKKEWQIARGALNTRMPILKPSTLDALFNCPFAALLDNALKLDPLGDCSLPDTTIMLGNFAHQLVELFLKDVLEQKKLPAPDTARDTMKALVDTHKAKSAAPLCSPENGAILESFTANMADAATWLLQKMASNKKLIHPVMEEKNQVPLNELQGVALKGQSDIVWHPKGNPIIWDMKYSGNVGKYRDYLDEGEAWQLAAYARMQTGPECTASAAYWLLKPNSLLGTSGSGAEDSELSDMAMKDCWDAAVENLKSIDSQWRHGQLDAIGTEVNNKGGEDKRKACGYCSLAWVCGGGYDD